MAWSDEITNLNDEIRGMFGEAATHTTQDGLTVTSIADLVIERLGDDGHAMCDIDSADVAIPGIGDLITIGSENWRIYDRSAFGSEYWPCELRQLSEWAQCTVHAYNRTSNAWNTTATATLWMHITAVTNMDNIDGDIGSVNSTDYSIVAPYNTALTQKVQIRWGSKRLYPTSVIADDSRSYQMTIEATEDES